MPHSSGFAGSAASAADSVPTTSPPSSNCCGCDFVASLLFQMHLQARRTAQKGFDGAQAASSRDHADAFADLWRLWECHRVQGESESRFLGCW
jgi:hypothetical protein